MRLPSYSADPKFARFFGYCFGKYSDEQFKEMAKKLDLVILDSYWYPNPPAILKDNKKNLIILAYMSPFDVSNMEKIYKQNMNKNSKGFRMYKEWKEISSHENWFFHDENGRRVRVYLNKKEERFGLDIENKGFQEFYSKLAAELVSNGYDGIFLDNVWVNYPYGSDFREFSSATPIGMNKEKWWKISVDFLKAIKEAIGKRILVFNQVRGYDTENSLKYLATCDGAMDENWLNNGNFYFKDFKEGIDIISVINKRNKISIPVAIGKKEADALRLYCSYLLVKEGDNAYFSYMKGYNFKGMIWYPFYELDLGKPNGNYYQQDGAVFRKFTNGLVIVNPNISSKNILLSEEYKTRDGTIVKEIVFKAREGDILLKKDVKLLLENKKIEFHGFGLLDFTKKAGPDEGQMNIPIDVDLKKAEKAFILLSLFDADNPSEGKIFINGNGPLDLPWGKGKSFNWKDFEFDSIAIGKNWLKNGENEIKFIKNKGGIFKVTKITLQLEYKSDLFPKIHEEEKDFSGLSGDLDFTKSDGLSEKGTAVFVDIDPGKTRRAFIILTLFDADNLNEGEFFINGKGPIPLPEGRGKDFNWKDYTFEPIPIDKSWLKKGWNGIRFRKKPKGIFKVSSLLIKMKFVEEK